MMNGLSGASAWASRKRVSAVLMSPRSRNAFACSASSFWRPCEGLSFCPVPLWEIGVGFGRLAAAVAEVDVMSGGAKVSFNFKAFNSSCCGSDARVRAAVSFCGIAWKRTMKTQATAAPWTRATTPRMTIDTKNVLPTDCFGMGEAVACIEWGGRKLKQNCVSGKCLIGPNQRSGSMLIPQSCSCFCSNGKRVK